LASLHEQGLDRVGSTTEIAEYEATLVNHAINRGDVVMSFAISAEAQACLHWAL
jgi:hypothetical protein